MRIITVNTNGIRAAARKGFFDWMGQQNADFVCIQETKAQVDQLTDPIFHPEGYYCYFFDAQKKGYSGTAIYSRYKPTLIHYGLGWDPLDSEGRYLQVDCGKLSVVSLYMPSGSSSDQAQEKKDFVLEKMITHFKSLRSKKQEFVICADWNICHNNIDIKNWRGNKRNSGFLPHERAWLDKLYNELGYVDSFREVNQNEGEYTWWSNRGQAWTNNTGWRLDYQVVTPGLKDAIQNASIYKDERFSDHAPHIMDYDFKL